MTMATGATPTDVAAEMYTIHFILNTHTETMAGTMTTSRDGAVARRLTREGQGQREGQRERRGRSAGLRRRRRRGVVVRREGPRAGTETAA